MTLVKLLLLSLLMTHKLIADQTQDLCHRASIDLECQMIHYKANYSPYSAGKFGIPYLTEIDVRVGVMSPLDQTIKGDVIYIHGFSDRLDNHVPLFKTFNQAGYRVISFDLPGHGENSGRSNNINDWSFRDLVKLTAFVENYIVTQSQIKPLELVLSGWSTGGLIALRAAQGLEKENFSRKISSLILFSPGVFVSGPFENKKGLIFGVTLFTNQTISNFIGLPENLPTLLFEADINEEIVFEKTIEFLSSPTK